ncbi:MAG TPA: helix-turn-helix transcriptional regulator [Candidatus Limnocylindrales bacterium]|nr:helix-turn-helix transcriptional regulator [Candidatus Limnocylindrales bacterium]
MDVVRLGRSVRALRVRRGLRQVDLACGAGVARSVVGRVERGERAGVTLDAIEAIAAALGATADLALRWQGEGMDRLLDEGHARLVDTVVRRLVALGWDVAVEVSFSRYGERGSIDVMAWHPVRRALVVIEVKSVTPDMQAMLGGIDRKARLGPAIARERGWPADAAARILVVWDTRTNRRRIEAHGPSVRAALPAGSREVTTWLADPAGTPVAGVWFVSDVRGADGKGVRRQRVRRPGGAPRTDSG